MNWFLVMGWLSLMSGIVIFIKYIIDTLYWKYEWQYDWIPSVEALYGVVAMFLGLVALLTGWSLA